MDSSLGFKVISTGKADARMDDEEVSDGASTGFDIHGSHHDLTRTSSTISVESASFHTADGLESDYPREYSLIRAERGGDDLSSRLIQQGAEYFSAQEGDSSSQSDDERSTLRADGYVMDPDQPKLALVEDSVHPLPVAEKHPPPQNEEYRGHGRREASRESRGAAAHETTPLLATSNGKKETSCCVLL